jgi:DNA-binding transcriptional MerR regulator
MPTSEHAALRATTTGPGAPGLTVAAVARRLGVAPATLRTWDRRYGLGPSEHAAGAHRRYSAVDVARLDLMRRLVNAGAPPGEAARAALDTDVHPEPPLAGPLPTLPDDDALDPGVAGVDLDPLLAQLTGAPGGGHVIPLPSGSPAVRGLARAAMSLDSVACIQIVRDTLESRGVVWTWDNMLAPVLVGIGQQWADTGRGVEVEHMLSESVISALTGVTTRLRRPVNPRPVLLASAADELHSLPLFAVAAALAERQVGSRVLGARVPHDALAGAIRRTGPCVVLVWSSLEAPGAADSLGTLPALRPAPLVLAAGPGWGHRLPDGVTGVHDLVDAVTRICAAAIV